jgi:class 3 adenylate cyclase
MFRANDIDIELLHRLTNEDLKDIGVASFGHRKKLLEAIAELGSAPAPLPAVPEPTPTPATVAPPPFSASIEATGERRHVTVMFCDLVDSAGIAARLDAEEWRDLVGAYLDAASVAVTEMGGKVAKKLGDGLMALFGYPMAQENDAERAVRAGLAIRDDDAQFWQKILKTARNETHYVIGRNGTAAQVMPPTDIAYHTVGINDVSMGIELVHRGDGIERFEEPQMVKLIELIREIRRRLPKFQ